MSVSDAMKILDDETQLHDVSFDTQSGEHRTLEQAHKVGLAQHLRRDGFFGLKSHIDSERHIYAVHPWLLRSIDGIQIVLK